MESITRDSISPLCAITPPDSFQPLASKLDTEMENIGSLGLEGNVKSRVKNYGKRN